MPSKLKLLELDSSGAYRELGVYDGSELAIGRDPASGILLDRNAISGRHGIFTRFHNNWFYKDLGSTNGSWLNGAVAAGGIWCLVRNGDSLQLADTALQIHNVSDARGEGMGEMGGSLGGRSLIVIGAGKLQDEFPVPEYGTALVIGGSRGDLALPGDLRESAALVVERRGNQVCAFQIDKDAEVLLNDQRIDDTVVLKDRDRLRVGQYLVIFNDQLQSRGASGFSQSGTGGELGQGYMSGSLKGWAQVSSTGPLPTEGIGRSATRVAASSVFGQSTKMLSEPEDEHSSDAATDGGNEFNPAEQHYGDRGVRGSPVSDSGGWSLEDRVIFALVTVLGLALLILTILLLLS